MGQALGGGMNALAMSAMGQSPMEWLQQQGVQPADLEGKLRELQAGGGKQPGFTDLLGAGLRGGTITAGQTPQFGQMGQGIGQNMLAQAQTPTNPSMLSPPQAPSMDIAQYIRLMQQMMG